MVRLCYYQINTIIGYFIFWTLCCMILYIDMFWCILRTYEELINGGTPYEKGIEVDATIGRKGKMLINSLNQLLNIRQESHSYDRTIILLNPWSACIWWATCEEAILCWSPAWGMIKFYAVAVFNVCIWYDDQLMQIVVLWLMMVNDAAYRGPHGDSLFLSWWIKFLGPNSL